MIMPREPGYLERADAAYDAGQFEKAMELYQKHIELEPEMPEGHEGLGLSLWALERHREALQALNTAQKFDPENAGIAINRAALLTDALERHEETVAICEGLARRKLKRNDVRDARYFAAKAHFRLGNDAKAPKRALVLSVSVAAGNCMAGTSNTNGYRHCPSPSWAMNMPGRRCSFAHWISSLVSPMPWPAAS